jgi:hypothetical protein
LESLQSLIEHYGYFAVFFGCFLEGETVLVLAASPRTWATCRCPA